MDYAERDFAPRRSHDCLFRYQDWLPVRRTLPGAARTAVYPSTGLGAFLGLPQLWIAFNGYWPERGCAMETVTFKELEAFSVLGRLPDDPPLVVLPSAGNTGAAFAVLASRYAVPCVIVVPARSLHRFAFREPIAPHVRLVALEEADYSDAIAFAGSLAAVLDGWIEGGTQNVARRAGLSTVLLSATEAMTRVPDYYFQAVGSGAGAIAVHEAARRLVGAGLGSRPPRLMLCQNSSCAPLYDAWQQDKPGHERAAEPASRTAAMTCFADELTNRHPPYAVRGGIRDCLTESSGDMLVADRSSAVEAQELFLRLEGIDIEPAAAVAVAGLRQAVAARRIPAQASVLLNITGGGRLRMAEQFGPTPAERVVFVSENEWRTGTLPKELTKRPRMSRA